MDLSDIGMQKNRFAVSAAVVHGVSACDEDRRRAYSAATFGQFNNGEIFTLAGIHMGEVRPRRDNDLYRWAHNQKQATSKLEFKIGPKTAGTGRF